MEQALGTKQRVTFNIYDTGMIIPATVIKGSRPGKQIALSAGVHSREYVGIQTLTELANEIRPEDVAGTIVILHCCNYNGFIQRSNEIVPEDNKNLNNAFPGNPDGTATEQIAAFLEENVIRSSDYIVDLHSSRGNSLLMPHAYFHNTAAPEVCAVSEKIARLTSVAYIVRSASEDGFYSYAGQCGVSGIILERGTLGLVDRHLVDMDKSDVLNILRGLDILNDGTAVKVYPKHMISRAYYENAPASGCWFRNFDPGDLVAKGDLLGEIRDIYGEVIERIYAKESGVMMYETISLGMEKGTQLLAYGVPDESVAE